MLRQTVNDNLVAEKWTLSGGGIIGELEKGTVKTRI
jgi:small subunit ribosomal protein S29